jgi:hypothetical protein
MDGTDDLLILRNSRWLARRLPEPLVEHLVTFVVLLPSV